jgi:cytochrome c nitrite reductase small subunit
MANEKERPSRISAHPALPVIFSLLMGALIGVGLFTFGYGKGHAYLSNDPLACAQCHIMQDHYDSWLKGSHHARATCNDCHLPGHFAGKWAAKADNGFFHSWAFTFQDFHEPIQIKERNLKILQDNCVDCHRTLVQQMPIEQVGGQALSCFHCHHSVGHGARTAGMPRRFPLTLTGAEP